MAKLKSMFLLLRDRKNGRFAAAGCPVQIGLPTTDLVLVKEGLLALIASIVIFLAELGLAALKSLREDS
ncbi:hypothetical protein [Pseudomonas savastanoi]|uniref:hypothetical protein n=1 Tax=Pseudomonas savastanoi TaxID=29438 RepID=UPI00198023BA|nr:hypothetical protein [Pseudomonas savastanoi]